MNKIHDLIKNKKYIIFDFNGTIIDDVDLCIECLNYLLRYNGQQECSYERYKEIFTFPIKEYYRRAGFDFNKHSYEHLANIFIDYYQKRSLDCALYPDSIETFKTLNDLGYHLIVLSASEINNLTEQLKHFGIYEHFYDVLGTSDIYAKSKVDVGLNYINSKNINKNEVIMFGDTLHDYEVSQKMGIECCLVKCGHQSENVLKQSNCVLINQISDLVK